MNILNLDSKSHCISKLKTVLHVLLKGSLREMEAAGLILGISLPHHLPYMAGRSTSEGLRLESDLK